MDNPMPASKEHGLPPGRRDTLVAVELKTTTQWLIRLRWFAGAGVLLCALFIGPVLGLDGIGYWLLWIVGIAVLAYNLIFYSIDRRLVASSTSPRTYRRLAFAQVALDWIAIVPLILVSGGLESPLILFFIFHIVIAAIFFSRKAGFWYTGLAVLFLAGIGLADTFLVEPETTLIDRLRLPFKSDPIFAAAVLVFFGFTGMVVTYLVSTISMRLSRREAEVERLNRDLRRSSARLKALNESARVVNSTLKLTQVLHRLVQNTAYVMGVHACSIRLLDKSGNLLEPVAVYGLSDDYLNKGPLDLSNDPLDKRVLSGEIVNVRDVTESPLLQYPERAIEEGIHSMLSAPLIGKSGPLGVLRAYCIERDRFTEDDIDFLSAIASQGSIAIENALAYEQIGDLDATKTTFMRVFTHELRSPVTVTRSLLQTLVAGYAGKLDDQQMDLVERAIRRVDFLGKLIDDLLELAADRVPTNVDELTEPVLVWDVLVKVVQRFEVPAQEHGLQLEWQDQTQRVPVKVYATEEGLDRIFNNLLSNAVKYTPSGGSIRVSLDSTGSQACVSIEDTGIGIPAESQPHLFEEFYRAPNAKAIEREGTGLGLVIVKELVNNFGGKISVHSQEDAGTRFDVTFPRLLQD